MRANPESAWYRGASCDLMELETNRHLDVSVTVATLLRAAGFWRTCSCRTLMITRQMNQLQGANIDTTLCPILTVDRTGRGSDPPPTVLSPTGHKLLQHLYFKFLNSAWKALSRTVMVSSTFHCLPTSCVIMLIPNHTLVIFHSMQWIPYGFDNRGTELSLPDRVRNNSLLHSIQPDSGSNPVSALK